MTNLHYSKQEANLLLEGEIWKDIPGYEGYYQVSNLGRVRSYARKIRSTINAKHPNSKPYRIQLGRILKPGISRGYKHASLNVEKVCKQMKVHRLVAFSFIPGYFEGAQVNHKDGNKLNNIASNLEWCTASQNTQHAHAVGLAKGRSGAKNTQSKQVLHKPTGIIYGSIQLAANSIGVSASNLGLYIRTNGKCYGSQRMKGILSEFVFK